MAIELKSFNQILGDMIRRIIAETPLSDVNAGSVLLSLLEACAANDFENNVAILNVLELLNIDATRNNDLDARAGDYGLSRLIATKSSGAVTIFNTNITKQSTGLYIIKPAPISGQTVIYVNNTTGWTPTGTLFIGRGTTSFEGPIPYTSIVVSPTFSQITLGAALQKDHLSSDTVINAQGEPDRIIATGTVVKIPANNQNPEVKYVTLRDAVLPSGEDRVDEVQVIAIVPGSAGNALINTITQFDTLPFIGAAVSNTSSFSNGTDIETDVQLRNRVKSYSTTLARGTAPAILAAVRNVSDPDDNAQVVSAVITQPIAIGEPSILYIDNGRGFQPSYAGQSVDILLSNANGTEEFLQLANFPLPRPQVVNTAIGPYSLTDSMFLRVAVDGQEDTVIFTTADFVNISAASVAELVVAINDKSTLFKARLANNSASILIYPIEFDAEVIQVVPLRTTDIEALHVNSILKFPTDEFSYISLFQNSTRLHQKEKKATIETLPFASWNIIGTGDIILSVDGTPAQDGTFTLGDFAGASSFTTLALEDWVIAFNNKFAGIEAVATPSQTMQLSSNRIGNESEIVVSGGSYLNQMFGTNTTSAVGQASEFEINRETGNIKILTTIVPGDIVTAGVVDAKGFAISSVTTSGSYNVGVDTFGRPAEMVILVDSRFCNTVSVPLLVGATMTVTDQGSSVMRITSSTLNAFANLQPGYFVYIIARTSGWFSAANSGLFKLVARGPHLTAGIDSYIEVLNDSIVPESVTVADATDMRGFYTDGYPQIWRGTYTTNPPAATLSDIVDSLNNSILGVTASIFRSNSIKLTSVTENDGSIAIPVSVGNAFSLFTETAEAQFGNPSEVANRVSDKSLFGLFRRTAAISSANVWLDRDTYTSISGPLTANAVPDPAPYIGPYSETVQATSVLTPANVGYADIVDFKRGNNRGLYKSIAAKIVTDSVGTQQGTPRTEFDHIIGDEILLMQSLKFSADDNMVFILDNQPSLETIDIKMARTGQVNSGSGGVFIPTTTEFSANDADNEPGVNFSNANVWGTTINGTNFADYAVLMRARNWYSTGGTAGTGGKMIIRATGYGENGNNMRFATKYPTVPNQTETTVLLNTPSNNLLSYFFGSGPDRATAIPNATTISVVGPYADKTTNFPNGATASGNYYDYTFSAGTLATVVIGDVLSILTSSGVSAFNSGQFGVQNLSGNTVRVFNPNGSPTYPGAPTVSTVTTVADIVGTPTNVTINVTSAAALDGTYFVIYDNAGTVKIWFDVDNNGTAEPVSIAYNRTIKIATLVAADTVAQVAVKIAAYLSNDVAFTNVFSTATQVLYQLAQNGPQPSPFNGIPTTSFTFVNTPGTADVTLNGKYFTIYDDVGSVAVWYDVGSVGTQQPFAGADRYIRVSTVNPGDTATIVAAATAAEVAADIKFSATSLANVITITTAFNASVPVTTANTSGFGVSTLQGSLTTDEVISNSGQLHFFPLTATDVASIIAAINDTNVLVAAAVGLDTLLITSSTEEETYLYAGNPSALGYGHNPAIAADRDHVNMYDGINWVKIFSNANPNFTLKTAMTLNGVAPLVYAFNTAPNDDATTGEYFKLVPTTVKNVNHHFTQKALSQLPIISSIAVSNAGQNVQIKSDQLGSAGAIEAVGGQANKATATLIGESEVATDISGEYLLFKIAAFPDSYSVGDIVKIDNAAGVKRLSRLETSDKIDVTIPVANTAEYNYNPKATNFISSTAFVITDVSATYSRPAGTVWRWTHGGGGATLADVNAGDLVFAFGSLSAGWSQGNKARIAGDSKVAGLPIINVNDGANWIDVVNPYGEAMGSTTIGSGTVQICPTPIIKWNLNHAANVHIVSMSRTTNVVTVNTTTHFLKTGDSVSIIDSNNLADGIYASITVLTATSFTFASIGTNFTEVDVGATVISTGVTRTRYRLEKLGINGLTRLVRQDGNSPRFADCGVAVDDYMVISGTTLVSNNNGMFRVLAVDNDSVIFINTNAVDALNTTKLFNNKGLLPTWTANSNFLTGTAGTFKNLVVGDWVKKTDDADSAYLQVTSFTPGTAALATIVTLGGNYSGISAVDAGIAYNQAIDYDKGVYLQNADDIVFYEGDSVVNGDTVFAQNIVNANWFNVNNTGNFEITQWGTNAITYKPFLRVTNPAAVAQTNVLMSVSVTGFYTMESITSKFYTYRLIYNSTIDDLNDSRRSLYLTPASRQYKFSQANSTFITSVDKLGYNTDVTVGIDGYLYYTGLLRRVQRIVDGFEPDAANFPGRRAVGGLIETLPPLIKNIIVAITVTTDDGVNIGDVSNNIKSAIINYIDSLGVGQDVILSEMIAAVMQIKGVAAVTFNRPLPSTERITVASNEKATIQPQSIGIA